jgi:hypothetical protein
MGAKVFVVKLTALELDAAIDGLEAALAGSYDEGDFCWSDTKAAAARRASEKLKNAMSAHYADSEGRR